MKNKYKFQFLVLTVLVFFPFYNSYSQLHGNYTIGSGGDYISITSAVTALVANGVNAPVIFNIQTGTYTENVTIDSIPGSSEINTITFQSQTGIITDVHWRQPFGYQTLLILNKADYITFKNIYFHNDDTNFFTIYAIYLINNCDNINFIQNNIEAPGFLTSYGIYSDNSSFKNLTIKENNIIAIRGIYLVASVRSTASQIFNNNIRGGIIIYNTDSLQIEKNTISTYSGFMFPQGPGIFLQNCNDYLKISKNKIVSDGDARLSPNSGIIIQSSLCQNSVIANNMIYYVAGDGISVSNSSNINIYYNTIQSLFFYTGDVTAPNLTLSNCINCNVKNNILEGRHTAFNNQSNSSLTSDFNSFFYSVPFGTAKMLYYNGTGYNDLTQYRAASNSEFNSKVQEVFFVSNTNLHLTGISIGDEGLSGTPITGIREDIDGDARSPFFPYKGADEADVTLPVELSSFTSAVSGRNVILNWSTVSEINNSGFDIERVALQSISDEWKHIGNVTGNGTSTGNSYTFTDRNLNSGKYKYRLKQNDFNGNFEYYYLNNEVNIDVPEKYELSQNYPNPFNPNTIINYSLPGTQYTILKVYDVRGNEVATLVNQKQNQGSYTYQFSTVNYHLSSGIYFYTLTAGDFKETKRMLLLK